MKKRKFNLLLQIATLCLCVAAIAFGVYSAKTASLNVSGTIGFTAHNCKVRVLGKITGAVDASNTAITNNTSTATINYTDSSNTSQGKLIEGTVDTWDFGKIYFDDLNTEGDAIATDIVFTFTLTNESTAYDVIATLNVNNLPSSIKPTVTFNTDSNNSGVECELKKSGTPVTITLTLSLLTGENISDTTKNLDIKLSFDKVNENQTVEKLGYTLNSSDKSILTGVPATTESNATLNIPSYFYDTTNSVVFIKSLGNNGPLTNANQYFIITIPHSVTTIGLSAFASCTNLTTITIPSSVTSIGNFAFTSCTGLTEITIQSGVTTIGHRAFRSCTSLTEITIQSCVTTIENEAFDGCTSLTTINILSGVTTIDSCVFLGTKFLTDLQTNHKGIYTCADGKKIVISVPTECTTIDLTGVVCIANNAFSGCTGLTTITIPSSVTTIGNSTFYGCTGLTTINFNGTKDQWNAITKDSSWNNNTGAYTIKCTDGTITKA